MLPSVVSGEVVEAVRQQLKAQFPSTTAGFLRSDSVTTAEAAIDDLLDRPGDVFKGPYLSFGLPFRKAADSESLPFEHLSIPYTPYLHQMKAFQRLTGPSPQPTLVATGTGSGKTECFMYPLLDHCAATRAPGIKALVIYPMNALAQDQARRFAQEIHGQEGLKGKVTVGLYTGDSKRGRTTMSGDSVITDRDAQQKNPPDILLTNYKMLDFLMIRPKDRKLWRHNEPGMLRYLVVDELHTFDGAQGTDLACLIRRLKDRLECTEEMACVGTSATVGDDLDALTDYASNVFDTRFREDSVLREERLTAAEFLPPTTLIDWPDVDDVIAFAGSEHQDQEAYLYDAVGLWLGKPVLQTLDFDDPLAFGEVLAKQLVALAPFKDLLEASTTITDKADLVNRWQRRWQTGVAPTLAAIDALIALASAARQGVQPLVTVREQLWMRELRRMVATVSVRPELRFHDDLKDSREEDGIDGELGAITLPVIHCNACHATGWLSQRRITRNQILRDVRTIYDGFFNKQPDTVAIYTDQSIPSVRACVHYRLCSHCGTLNTLGKGAGDAEAKQVCDTCERGEESLVGVVLPEMNHQRTVNNADTLRFNNCCPYCDTNDSLFILGSRAATLSSVAINRLYNSRYNDHAKLIAFSDSVQDAAHRAGFFGARTYSDVVRSALVVAIESGEFSNLAELVDGFGNYWLKRFAENDELETDFVATFLPPDLAWLNDWDELQLTDRLPAKSTMVSRWILPRLRWEVLVAFGLRARKGRTVERTERATVQLSSTVIEKIVSGALSVIQEEVAGLRSLDESLLRQFITGLIWHLRTRGAIYDPLLENYIQSGGDIYKIRNNRFNQHLPAIGNSSSPPAFISLRKLGGKNARHFDSVVDGGGTWYSHWFNKLLAVDNVSASSMTDVVYSIVFKAAVKAGAATAHEVREHTVWSLSAEHWLLSANVATVVCDQCRHRVQIPEDAVEQWTGMPCVRSHCHGQSFVDDKSGKESGAGLNVNTPVRLVAAEHTAVLDTETRAQVEGSFKRNPGQRWDINLLSATPTMEMGVDIGDLSSVLLCSVPPAQANYLQRIGRAGRKDGNAFNLTIATGMPHDLYFYSNPIEMMSGSVQPPGVFLDAVAVLERQLLAFCMDRWVQSDVADDAIPDKLKEVLDAVDNGSAKQFPHNFLKYVDRERGLLLTDFQHLFRRLQARRAAPDSGTGGRGLFKGLTAEGVNQLSDFLHGSLGITGSRPSIVMRLTNLFEDKAKQRKRLQKEVAQLKRERDRLEQLPADESRDSNLSEVVAERSAIQRLVRGINRQLTLNFLTDEGVLPNYAFPEEGVKLNSVIFRRRELAQSEEDGKGYEKIELEIRRPAQVALRELAPHSRFYGNSRQVQIDQVMVGTDDVEVWRFCASCNHGLMLPTTAVDEHTTCPRCGHADWHSSDQKMSLLKLREVYANASDRDSRIGDDSDDREPVFFNRQFLFDLDPSAIERGWRIEEATCPFGFEYLSKATFREINFGKQDESGPVLEIAGEKSPRSGFPVCKHCGKVRMWRPREEDNHTRRCKMYGADKETQDHDDNLWPNLYLYRELQSEAIRILLPLADLAHSEVRLQSFIAALHLGLKKHFHGNVDHLQIMHVSEPVAGSQLRRQYLVLLDSVPGGTGYLAELSTDPDNFRKMLVHTQSVMEQCECQNDPQADGCYRCLYAYRSSNQMDSISRAAALDAIGTILSHWDVLAPLERGDTLGHTEMNSLYDSELELRFISTLSSTRGCAVAERRVGTKGGYELTIRNDITESGRSQAGPSRNTRWFIELQVDYNEGDNVAVACRPDFVLHCLSHDEGEVLPVAVFTDGFEYHANNQAQDTAKRFALMSSGKFRVWTLGWHDMENNDESKEYPLLNWFSQPEDSDLINSLYDKMAQALGFPVYAQQPAVMRATAFEQLLHYLSDPLGAIGDYSRWGVSRVFGVTNVKTSESQDKTLQQVGTWLPVLWQEQMLSGDGLLGNCELPGMPVVSAVGAVPRSDLDTLTATANDRRDADAPVILPPLNMSLCLLLDDRNTGAAGYQDSWKRYWAAVNLFQFLPNFLPASRTGIEEQVYAPVIEFSAPGGARSVADRTSAKPVLDEDWLEALKITFFPDLLTELSTRTVPAPEISKEVMQGDRIVAQLEWAWVEQLIGLADSLSDSEIKTLQGMGWRLVLSSDENIAGKVMDCFAEGNK